jgi:hypothetical protein
LVSRNDETFLPRTEPPAMSEKLLLLLVLVGIGSMMFATGFVLVAS